MDEGLLEAVPARRLWEASKPTKQSFGRYLAYGAQPAPVPSYCGTVEAPQAGAIGVCCSGGGVRSAAFNLGALQALAQAEELQRSRYLAAVSGGSYIAAAFSMVAKTWPSSGTGEPAAQQAQAASPRKDRARCPQSRRPPRERDEPDNGHDDSNPELIEKQPPFAPRSPEEQYLRNRSSYLAPSVMDKLYLGYRVVLGVLFNIAFLALPLFGVAVLLAVLAYRPAFPHLLGACGSACRAPVPSYMWLPPACLAGLSAVLGLAVLLVRIPRDLVRRGFEVWSTRLLVLAAVVAWLTVALPELVDVLTVGGSIGTPAGKTGIAGAGGLTGLLVAVAVQLRETLTSATKLVKGYEEVENRWSKLSSLARRAIAYALAAVAGPALLLGAMVLGAALALANSRSGHVNGWLVLAGLGALALFAAIYAWVDLTSWSLHPFYKRRLCTAFALKRVLALDQEPGEDGYVERVGQSDPTERAAEAHTAEGTPVVPVTAAGSGGLRAIAVERDFDMLVPLSKTALTGGKWPTLLICAAANISDGGATPPGRCVTSFTFSAHTIGGPLVGAIATKDFERAFADAPFTKRRGSRSRDLSLPSAVAMSGAALSPSMGKMTSRPLTFLMALANVRLGVWVPNPRWVSSPKLDKRKEAFGRARPSYLVRELFGRNRVNARYLYVTDGGHYENLGLVELLRRGCTEIYCFDASGSKDFQELGDAIALARSELGVEIEIDLKLLLPDADGVAEAEAVTGQVEYADGTQGVLIYARTVITKSAPWDVRAYRERDPRFPDDPTVDQLYTDQRFEAYRKLGIAAGRQAIDSMAEARA